MPDPLREALEQYVEAADWYRRCLEDVRDKRPVRGFDEAELSYFRALGNARAALAASPPPARTEWRVLNRNGGVVPGGYELTEAAARSWLPDLNASFPDFAPYRVERRDVFYGPWQDVPSEGEGA